MDPEDRTQREGVPPEDGRPRRQPPIIDIEAVEVSLGGSGGATTGSGPAANPSSATRWSTRISAFLSPMTLAIIGSACVIAGIIAGALWFYLTSDGTDGPQRSAEASPAAAVPAPFPALPPTAGEGREDIAKLDMLKAPPSQASQPPYPQGAEGKSPYPPPQARRVGGSVAQHTICRAQRIRRLRWQTRKTGRSATVSPRRTGVRAGSRQSST